MRIEIGWIREKLGLIKKGITGSRFRSSQYHYLISSLRHQKLAKKQSFDTALEPSPKRQFEYYQNNIGQSTPGAPSRHAFLVSGRVEMDDEWSAPILVQNTFLKHGAKIVFLTERLDEDHKEFTLSLCCDLKGLEVTSENLVDELRRLGFVSNATSVNMKDRFFDGLQFPLTLLDTVRVVAIKSDLTFAIEERLKTPAEKSALFEVGRIYSLEIVRLIKQRLGRGVPDATIQENMMGYLRAAGWGAFKHESYGDLKIDHMLIQDPPTSKRGEAAGNHFIQGIAAGVVESFQGRRLCVLEDIYDPSNRLLSLTLVDEPTSLSTSSPPSKKRQGIQSVEAEIKPMKAVEPVKRSSVLEDSEDTLSIFSEI